MKAIKRVKAGIKDVQVRKRPSFHELCHSLTVVKKARGCLDLMNPGVKPNVYTVGFLGDL